MSFCKNPLEPIALQKIIFSPKPSKSFKEIQLEYKKTLICEIFLTAVWMGGIVVCSLGLRGYFSYDSTALYGTMITLCAVCLIAQYRRYNSLYDSYLGLKQLSIKQI